jgi:sugar phosphate isomerase/epimerase
MGTRRDFIKNTAGLVAIAYTGSSFITKKDRHLLSFSTLGCPDWPFQRIVNFAADNGYNGIEMRGILRQLDLTKCPEFSTPENIAASLKMMQDKGLAFVNLGASTALHFPEGAERQKNIDEGKRFIDLAHQLKCPYIRVFPNNLPKDQDRAATISLIAKGLHELGDYSKGSDVKVLMETHGEVVEAGLIKKIMQAADHPRVGLVWDVYNMWSVTKENPAMVYQLLKEYIHHTHIKDAKNINGKEQYVFLGTGDSPIFEAIDLLSKDNYKGYYSFEWEKLWHPEIAEPELALADYPKAIKQHFQEMQNVK